MPERWRWGLSMIGGFFFDQNATCLSVWGRVADGVVAGGGVRWCNMKVVMLRDFGKEQ